MSKITCTDKGVELRKQLSQELQQEGVVSGYFGKQKQQLAQQKKSVFGGQKDLFIFGGGAVENIYSAEGKNSRNSPAEYQFHHGNQQNQLGNKSGNALDLLREHEQQIQYKMRSQESVKDFLLPNVDSSKLTPYIKRKLDYVSQQIVQGGPNQNSQGHHHHPQQWKKKLGSDYPSIFIKSTNDMKSIFNHSQFIKGEPSILSGNPFQDKQNKIILYEGKFQRLLDNYNFLEEQRKKETQQLQKQMAKSPKLQALLTRPETIQEIHTKYQDTIEIINQQNNQVNRQKKLYFQIHQRGIQNKWNQTYFPLTFKERVNNNKRIEFQTKVKPLRYATENEQQDENQEKKLWKL